MFSQITTKIHGKSLGRLWESNFYVPKHLSSVQKLHTNATGYKALLIGQSMKHVVKGLGGDIKIIVMVIVLTSTRNIWL